MARVRLLVWKAEEAEDRAAIVRKLGHEVDARFVDGQEIMRDLRRTIPDAIAVDLGRLPSKGRYVGYAVRTSKVLRQVPLVFIGGDPEKVRQVRDLLPDATFCDWRNLGPALKKLPKTPQQFGAPTASAVWGYHNRPIVEKLGVREGMKVRLLGAPASFLKASGLDEEEVDQPDLTICFVTSQCDLAASIRSLARNTPVWIAWPKQKARRGGSDLTQHAVREIGFSVGLVDYKICAIDEKWSGMLFSRRRTPRT